MAKILLIEDDYLLALTINKSLSDEHYTVEVCNNGNEGLERLLGSKLDLVIIDWGLPDTDGINICQEYRKKGGNTRDPDAHWQIKDRRENKGS